MGKYTLIKDSRQDTDDFGYEVIMNFETETLHQTIEHMETFLKACGFTLKGTLDIVEGEIND